MSHLISEIQRKVDQLKGQFIQLKRDARKLKKDTIQLKKNAELLQQAREIIKLVAIKTQSEISFHIEDITGLALTSIMEHPYELKLEFVERRDRIECDFLFVREDLQIDPYEGGGGALDIGSFALRVASLSMQEFPSRSILILDEPFKHLKGERDNEKMLEMLLQISKRLNIQVIMVSDERVDRSITMDYSDKLFHVKSNKKGVSTVTIKK